VSHAEPSPRVLVVNCGSSSLKYRLVEPGSGAVVGGGMVDRLTGPDAVLVHDGERESLGRSDHGGALRAVLRAFERSGHPLDGEGVVAVGHRVVHGGARFHAPVVIDDAVLASIEEIVPLAPLHNPAHLLGIRTAMTAIPGVPHVAVFDTAFHMTIPPHASTYAVPAAWRDDLGVRRYGFHGTSYAYVSRETARLLGRPVEDTNSIILHLGNGASACAVRGGRSVDTSMGLTPLQGLVMGTRSGDVDPALAAYLQRAIGIDAVEVEETLNRASGMLGLTGASDLREIEERDENGDEQARLALEIYAYRIRCYVGAYQAALGRVDAIVFTAGVGENSPEIRRLVLEGLEPLGIELDPSHNTSGRGARTISAASSRVTVLVVPTDEEREIASQALALVTSGSIHTQK
jgi:acetate kinase